MAWRCGRCSGTPEAHGEPDSQCVYEPVLLSEPAEYGDAHPCPDCGCQCAPWEWSCWRCGAVQE